MIYYWNRLVELPAWKRKTARRWRAALQWMAFRGASWEWDTEMPKGMMLSLNVSKILTCITGVIHPQAAHQPTLILSNSCHQRSQRIPTLPFLDLVPASKQQRFLVARTTAKNASTKTQAVVVADSSLGAIFNICCQSSKQQDDLQTTKAFCANKISAMDQNPAGFHILVARQMDNIPRFIWKLVSLNITPKMEFSCTASTPSHHP